MARYYNLHRSKLSSIRSATMARVPLITLTTFIAATSAFVQTANYAVSRAHQCSFSSTAIMSAAVNAKYSSIEDALQGLAYIPRMRNEDGYKLDGRDRDRLYCLAAEIEKNGKDDERFEYLPCYFVTDGSIKFRHEGSLNRMPDKFFLCDRQEEDLNKKVLVFCSASGSGKTVELAASSATRGVDLAIVISMAYYTEDRKATDTERRNKVSMALLKAKIQEVRKYTPILGSLVGLATDERPLRINLGIDDASTCPKLVRSIIADQASASEAVVAALTEPGATANIDVSFSVAGAGAHTGVVGSNTNNFKVVNPAARSFTAELSNHFLTNTTCLIATGETETETQAHEQVTYELIKKNLPLVATLMENGRMASIAATKLRRIAERNMEVAEAKLVSEIIESYMNSNAMKTLVGQRTEEQIVAACAIAAHLFQWDKDKPGQPVPKNEEEFLTFVSRMECGVEFRDEIEKKVTKGGGAAMQDIVSRFGLLEPSMESSQLKPGDKPSNLFIMTPSQQLVALKMLGMILTNEFECLGTHIVKCAIASSCMIKHECRPDLQSLLTKIGFGVETHVTSDEVRAKWKALSKYIVTPHYLQNRDFVRNNHWWNPEWEYGWNPEWESYQAKFHWTKRMKVGLNRIYDDRDVGHLQICSDTYEALSDMHRTRSYYASEALLPSALMNCGSSPFADGFVTFFCKEDGSRSIRYTLMIQAADSYKASHSYIEKMNEYAETCNDDSLNGVFGEKKNRLFCVAGSHNKLATGEPSCTKKQNFITYASNTCKILPALLSVLEHQQRDPKRMMCESGSATTICDSQGRKVDPQTLQKKL